MELDSGGPMQLSADLAVVDLLSGYTVRVMFGEQSGVPVAVAVDVRRDLGVCRKTIVHAGAVLLDCRFRDPLQQAPM